MRLFKAADGKTHQLNDDEPPVDGFHTDELLDKAKDKYLQDNLIGVVRGYAKVGEVAPLLARSQFAMTKKESDLVKAAKGPFSARKEKPEAARA